MSCSTLTSWLCQSFPHRHTALTISFPGQPLFSAHRTDLICPIPTPSLMLCFVQSLTCLPKKSASPLLLPQYLVYIIISICQIIALPSEKAMAPHSSTLAWKIPWMEEPGRLQSRGSLSQTRLSDFTFTFHFHALEEEMATHSNVLAWKIPGMAGPGGLLSMRSHRVGQDWSNLAAAADGL